MRKPIAILAMMVWLVVWIVGVATLSGYVNAWPRAVQLVFYVIAGVGWIFPLKPLFAWMNTPEA